MTLFDIKYDDFKREDTTNVITITLYTDDKQPITPNSSHTWKAKVSKEDKYVGEYPVTISGDTIKLSSSNLTRLPNGDYGLELWETYSGSTTIYPSAGVMEFRVHRNANDTLGTVDPTTDINGIIDDLHKAGQNIKVVATNTLPAGSKASVTQSITNGENQLTFNIPQGPKGENGDVGPAPTLKIGTVTKLDPDQTPTADLTGGNGTYTLNMGIPQGVQGETNETATNALNLSNSVNDKVTEIQSNGGGRNLLLGTTNDWVTKTASGWMNVTTANDTKISVTDFQSGDKFTYSAVITNKSNTNVRLEMYQIDKNGARITTGNGFYVASDYVAPNTTAQKVSCTITINADTWFVEHSLIAEGGTSTSKTVQIKDEMLETGIVAHDWRPAPEDIDAINTKVNSITSNGGGRNLARGTSSEWVDLTNFDNKTNYSVSPANIYLDTLQVGDTMTWGITLKNTDITSGEFVLQGSGDVTGWTSGTLFGKQYTISNDLPAGTTKTFIISTVINDMQKKNDYFEVQLRTDNIPKGGTLSYRSFFAERGIVVHDWSPAPEDIQSEIDALKEAVKKLGGQSSPTGSSGNA